MPYTKYRPGEDEWTTFGDFTSGKTQYRVPGYSQADQGDVSYNLDWWYICVFYLQYLVMLLFNFAGLYGAMYQSYNMAGVKDSRKLTMTLAVWTSHQHATKGAAISTLFYSWTFSCTIIITPFFARLSRTVLHSAWC